MEITLGLISLPFWTANFQQVFYILNFAMLLLGNSQCKHFSSFFFFVYILHYTSRVPYAFLFIIFIITMVVCLSSWVCCLITLTSICYQFCISHSKYSEHICLFFAVHPSYTILIFTKTLPEITTVIFMQNVKCLICCIRY